MYEIDIMTLFDLTVGDMMNESVLGRAQERDLLRIEAHQIRDYTLNKQKQVDDYPYGGGRGAVMQADPLYQCWRHIVDAYGPGRTIYLSPAGKTFCEADARRLRDGYSHLILVCGHYEGIDERFIEECVDEEISLGDFVLTGGEIAAMAVADCVCRMVPGVLADEECYTGESHWGGLLEYPQYTRPEVWEGRAVPEVLLTGDHAKVAKWRRKKQLERTLDKRPDMFEKLELGDKMDRKLVEEIKYERLPEGEKLRFEPRRAEPSDVPGVMQIVAQAQRYLRESGVDQWQDGYPREEVLYGDIELGRGWVFEHEGELAGYVCISMLHEPSYDVIDGAWLTEGDNYAVVHRAMTADKYRGTRLARDMFSLAFDLAAGLGKSSVRVDTHRDNRAMNRLASEKLGFTYCGEVDVSLMDPGHDSRRNAYEKLI